MTDELAKEARRDEELEVQRAIAEAFDEVASEKAAVIERVRAIHWPRKITTVRPDGSAETVVVCASNICGAWPCETGIALDGAHSPTDVPTPVSAATEAQGGAREAQEG